MSRAGGDFQVESAERINFVQPAAKKKQPENPPVNMEYLDREESLSEISDRWRALTLDAEVPVYLTYEWLSRWWKHFGKHPKREIFVVTLYHHAELIGLAPLFIGISSVGSVTLQKRLQLMGTGVDDNEFLGFSDAYGYSDFLDIIAHPDYREVVADKLTNLFVANPMHVDVINFHHVSDESFVMTEILPRLEDKGQNIQLEQSDVCPYLTVPDSMDEYKANQLGKSSRRRRFRKNIKPVGNKYPVEKLTSREEVMKGLDSLYELHQQRWNSLGYPGAFYDERHHSFLLDMGRKAFENGWCWLVQARDDEGCAAIRLALKYNGRYYDWSSGFNSSSSISKHRPGLGLLAMMIKEGIEEGAFRIELLRGDERYKFDFTDEARRNWKLKMPVYEDRTFFRSVINRMVEQMAGIYYRLQREYKLFDVHYKQEQNLFYSFKSYCLFRWETVLEKFKDLKLFAEED